MNWRKKVITFTLSVCALNLYYLEAGSKEFLDVIELAAEGIPPSEAQVVQAFLKVVKRFAAVLQVDKRNPLPPPRAVSYRGRQTPFILITPLGLSHMSYQGNDQSSH
ncbi:hypothetical protein AVEN_97192-1 [Araneus ventricosus]|uniref:Uncharacterized protein n=1 Tax=Araneus ventricosus TaxID=182803 RepID=A0A4Y2DFQ5_ARAVE|nr:hypothetical protein AVEN_97192-1 [Araneus ventricosus]